MWFSVVFRTTLKLNLIIGSYIIIFSIIFHNLDGCYIYKSKNQGRHFVWQGILMLLLVWARNKALLCFYHIMGETKWIMILMSATLSKSIARIYNDSNRVEVKVLESLLWFPIYKSFICVGFDLWLHKISLFGSNSANLTKSSALLVPPEKNTIHHLLLAYTHIHV